jgi:hypothetical protein
LVDSKPHARVSPPSTIPLSVTVHEEVDSTVLVTGSDEARLRTASLIASFAKFEGEGR